MLVWCIIIAEITYSPTAGGGVYVDDDADGVVTRNGVHVTSLSWYYEELHWDKVYELCVSMLLISHYCPQYCTSSLDWVSVSNGYQIYISWPDGQWCKVKGLTQKDNPAL